jgi:hypothetical protein
LATPFWRKKNLEKMQATRQYKKRKKTIGYVPKKQKNQSKSTLTGKNMPSLRLY